MNYPLGYTMLQNTNKLVYNLDPPNVEMHCLYGRNVSTEETYFYSNQTMFAVSDAQIVYGDGDGTVNLRSLLGFKRWISMQPQKIFSKEFFGVSHGAILFYPPVINYILNLLVEPV